jgi:hypothetical protein
MSSSRIRVRHLPSGRAIEVPTAFLTLQELVPGEVSWSVEFPDWFDPPLQVGDDVHLTLEDGRSATAQVRNTLITIDMVDALITCVGSEPLLPRDEPSAGA